MAKSYLLMNSNRLSTVIVGWTVDRLMNSVPANEQCHQGPIGWWIDECRQYLQADKQWSVNEQWPAGWAVTDQLCAWWPICMADDASLTHTCHVFSYTWRVEVIWKPVCIWNENFLAILEVNIYLEGRRLTEKRPTREVLKELAVSAV